MILVDTSIWVDHLRRSDGRLVRALNAAQVLTHPFVIGELACGNLKQRTTVLALLHDLPRSSHASDDEVMFYIDQHQLMGRGIGYVDAHLLAAVTLSGAARLWTRDKRLNAIADQLGLAHIPG
ncbi:MAG: type II toxin-antitoxin system VapC family toxin [Gammaproteobacteria bacterium]|nr:type II toxin-antitoxin system VapC family toxin [Gammaproteobacteria bacterium]